MYAVISIGGKQARVAVGDVVEVELVAEGNGETVTFAPLLVVDGEQVVVEPGDLGAYTVSGVVTGESKGPKITGFTYQAKARRRRRYGHRQHYTTVEITEIAGAKTRTAARSEA
ncbi:MAG TPA: 50S ribosomal protein L21 [Acidimicrobiales bacterium]|nr:50S ribosomal protein L21 [Acidimicrobiales bacterium]